MRRFLPILAASVLAGCATSGLATLPPGQQADARRVESYVGGLQSLHGQFLQTGPEDGAVSRGTFSYTPGHLSLAYITPQIMHLTAGDGRIVMEDSSTGAVTHLSLARNPLGLLLRTPFRLGDGIQVTSVQHSAGALQLSASQADNPSQGRLTLQFADSAAGLRLIGLDGVDARDHHVVLHLYATMPASGG